MANRKTRLMLLQWIYLILTWLLLFYLYYFLVYWGTGVFYADTILKSYIFSYKAHVEIILAAFIFGLLFGIINSITEIKQISRRSFTFIVFIKSVLYIVAFLFVFIMIFFVFQALNIFPQDLLYSLQNITAYHLIISFSLYFIICIILVNVAVQLDKKFGPGELTKILSGRYHQPKEENRVFLFVDMKSSTTIAEKLGNKNYSRLIRQCFLDLSDLIIEHQASIYQHVGDEIVLTWEKEKAFKKLNAINLFFSFSDKLQVKGSFYQKKFGVIPEFKAALHMGRIVVAETGDLKREIAYHGDVINTTARIEKQCNVLEEKLLISQTVKDNLSIHNGYILINHGDVNLKGKVSTLNIYGVRR